MARSEGSGGNNRGRRESFGNVRQLPSGRYQARYTHPRTKATVKAPTTFTGITAARAWLRREAVRLESEAAGAPVAAVRSKVTLAEYGTKWLERRDHRPTTRRTYAGLWRTIEADLGRRRLADITPADVSEWHSTLHPGRPTARAHTYALLRSIYGTALRERLVSENPCTVEGAGIARRDREIAVVSPAQIADLEASMPPRFAAMVTLAAWCGLRFGEIVELRRGDVDLDGGTVSVTRSATRAAGGMVVGPPKTKAGRRVVAIPPHVLPKVQAHLEAHVAEGSDAMLFPLSRGGTTHLDYGSSFGYPWRNARAAAGLPDLRFHDLRHTALTMAAQAGATTAELARRAGHSSLAAVAIYQHAAEERDRELAARLSARTSAAGGHVRA